MAFDFSTLVTDRTQQDVAYAKQLVEKLVTGTATDEEKAEWNSFTLKGAYNHTDFNRVTEAMRYLVSRLRSYGYAVNFSEIALPRSDYTLDVVLKPLVIESGADYDSYTFETSGTGLFLCSVAGNDFSVGASIQVLEDKDYTVDLSKLKLWLYNNGDECVSITGGWSADGYTDTYGLLPATKLDNSFYADTSNAEVDLLSTVNKVCFSGYTKLCVEWMHTDATNVTQPWFGVCNSKNFSDRVLRFGGSQANVREITTVDISDLNDDYYVIMCHTNGTYSGAGYLYAVWLEK